MGRTDKNRPRFSAHIEQLEIRQVMSADPLLGGSIEHHLLVEPPQVEQTAVASSELPPLDQHTLPPLSSGLMGEPDFWIDPEDATGFADDLREIEQALTEAHNQTGWFNVQSNYGFTGIGQTVAVIDSGIAYDHFALGGGLGANYRVVGGWDFTEENDANPYDDGAAGGHGTHVAGIVGSSSSTHSGVAPGVDIVGLRVFNDAGSGYFTWVENALKWVLQNRNSFENPITAINLSLGVSTWNSAATPNWANLEDEFQQLEAAGIFIAVSAGNSYGSYNQPGLSYPAASQYVVPVMSSDDNGTLSYYSQRLQRAIAAPGRTIVSTLPDYKGNNNGVADDFGASSGTSMAAPYVAGASVLVRQAMQFVGMTNITQDMIFNHMMATADSFVDAASNLTYKRLNLGAAIDALMPTDDYGSTAATAFNLGTVSNTASINGTIGKLTDADFFKFTAGSTGRVSFEVTSTQQNMTPSWQVLAASGQQLAAANGSEVGFDVVAGQTYTVRLTSTGGMGRYSFDVAAEASFTFEDWGTVAYSQINDVAAAGEKWYRVQASQAGFLTVQGGFNAAGGNVTVDLYNANMQLVANGVTAAGQARVNVTATAGTQYFVRVTGTNSDVDFKLLNLVSQSGSTVTAVGTAGNDAFSVTTFATRDLTFNGVTYSFAAASAAQINIDGGAGSDTVAIYGTTAVDTATLRAASASLVATGIRVDAVNFETQNVHSGGGADTAHIYDSAGNDTLLAWADKVTLTLSTGQSLTASGFAQARTYASAGFDVARFYDTAGNEDYRSYFDKATMTGVGFLNYAASFDETYAYASTGFDRAFFQDSAGNDDYRAYPSWASMTGAGYYNYGRTFDETYAYGTGGLDRAILFDSAGDDFFRTNEDRAMMQGPGYFNYARGFEESYGYATTGFDKAVMTDSAGDDIFRTYSNKATLHGPGYLHYANSFDEYYAYATTGNDRVIMYDSAGDDVYRVYDGKATMNGAGFYHYGTGFDRYEAHSSTGNDLAVYYDSAGNDTLTLRTGTVRLAALAAYYDAMNFDRVEAYSTLGGNDTIDLGAIDYLFNSFGNWR